MWDWLWILPVHVIAHAATASDGTGDSPMHIVWWDIVAGSAVCGLSAMCLAVTIQLLKGPKWCWLVMAADVAVVYLLRSPQGPMKTIWPSVYPLARSSALTIVLLLLLFHAVMTVYASEIVYGIFGGIVPCVYVAAALLRTDKTSGTAPIDSWERAPLDTVLSVNKQDENANDVVANAFRPLLQRWAETNGNVSLRRARTPGSGDGTLY